MPLERRISFVSTLTVPWGGSEELWSRTALDLAAQGFQVSASVAASSPLHRRVVELMERGVEVWLRPHPYPLWKQARRRLITPHKDPVTLEVQRLVAARPPRLVVLSDGGDLPPVDLLEMCVAKRLAFVTISHAVFVNRWRDDDLAARFRRVMAGALRCYFVSHANRRLTETLIGGEFSNAEVVRNPVNVDFDASPRWPHLARDGELRLACVGRLYPPAKGQDILFEALTRPVWAARRWRLHLYGEGPMRNGLERLAQRLGLAERVVFAGHRAVEEIWASNHVLVMPSRYEGLPMAMVEAMLCGRPVVATDVAGHSEIVEDGVTGFLADAPTANSMANALERFWARRAEAEEIGIAAAKRIRQLVPADPVRIFSDKIKEIATTQRCANTISYEHGSVDELHERREVKGCQ
jgi:glycosyltransferase involved in cell wall biosynthesis